MAPSLLIVVCHSGKAPSGTEMDVLRHKCSGFVFKARFYVAAVIIIIKEFFTPLWLDLAIGNRLACHRTEYTHL